MKGVTAVVTTSKGLRAEAGIDRTIHPAGQKVSDEQVAPLNLTKEGFHDERNDPLAPSQREEAYIRLCNDLDDGRG